MTQKENKALKRYQDLDEGGLVKALDNFLPGISQETNFQPGNLVYLILDHSGSMARGNKLNQAKEGAIDFAREAIGKGYRVGIIVFSDEAEEICSPGTDLNLMKLKMKPILANGSTYMCKAIRMAIELMRFDGLRVICLATDGMPNSLKGALKAAKEAKEKGIEIMIIGTDDADREFLAQLASSDNLVSKVEFFELKKAFSQMSKHLALPAPK